MTILRNKRDHKFSIIDNDVLNNRSLSFMARGLLAYMLSKPDDWKFRTTALAKRSPKDGVTAICSALAEIEKAGYLIRRENRKENGQFDGTDWNWKLVDTPTFSPQSGFPHTEKTNTENLTLLRTVAKDDQISK